MNAVAAQTRSFVFRKFFLLSLLSFFCLAFFLMGCASVPVQEKTRTDPVHASTVPAAKEGAGQNPSLSRAEMESLLRLPGKVRDGEAFLLDFSALGSQKVSLLWQGKTLVLHPDQGTNRCLALLPVPLSEKAASLPLIVTVQRHNGSHERFMASLPVEKGSYPVQRLTVEQKFVTPPVAVQEKIRKDRAELLEVINKVSPVRYWSLPLRKPVPGEITSQYGLRRVFNGQPRNPHKGVDFSASEGDCVAAADSGVVVLVSGHYYGGNTVVVDHGLGVFTLYLHLSAFNVKKGQHISRGETVGLIGHTGRVTGPHLHLSFAVLGEIVNAAPCLAM